MRKLPLMHVMNPSVTTLVFALCFSLFSVSIIAQEFSMDDQSSDMDSGFHPAISIGLSTGTHAIIGGDVTIGFLEAVNFRISYNRIRASLSDFSIDAAEFGVSDQTLVLDTDFNLSTLGFLVDYPITKSKKVRVMAGAMLELDNFITISGRFSDNIIINDFVLTPERLGTIGGTYRTKSSIYPYLGMGLGHSLAANKLTFSFEAGVYLRGKPQITVESSGVLGGNEGNGAVLSNNLEAWQWHPSIGIRLAYGFHVGKKREKKPKVEEGPMTEDESIISAIQENPEPKKRRSKKEKTTEPNATSSTQEAETMAKPTAPVSRFLALKGQAIDGSTGNNLPYIVVDLYKVISGGQKQKALSQRYPGGKFAIDLERGVTYEIVLTHYLYMDNVTTITADADPALSTTTKTFTLNQK
ncbi:MAG: hypothetical protein HRU40_11105 [Saprospiraceae bacterium]|nr:hypothetical protein [Saprospiraceae bacterium]